MNWSRLHARTPGQSTVMLAVMLSIFLGLMALGVDAVSMYAERRRAQAVADMAAMGGAMEIDGSGTGATNANTAAQAIITANGYTSGTASGQATICVNAYYVANSNTCMSPPPSSSGTSAALEVTITYHAPTIFAMTMGRSTTDVLGRAVATRQGINQYAVYSNSTSCSNPDGIKALGSGGTVNGRVHTNSELNIGNNWTFNGSVTYYGSSGCTMSDNNAAVPVSVGLQSWPLSASVRDITQYTCTYDWTGDVSASGYNASTLPSAHEGTFNVDSDGVWWTDATHTKLKDGVYCVKATSGNSSLNMSTNNASGTVTFVAAGSRATISVNSNNFTLLPKVNNILMFNQDSTDTTSISAQGGGGAWEGWIYSRVGGIRMTGGGGLTLTGGLFGDTVNLVGSGWSLLGTGPNSGYTGKLTE